EDPVPSQAARFERLKIAILDLPYPSRFSGVSSGPMKVRKAAVRMAETGDWKVCDALEYQGRDWLVAKWLDNQTLRISKPTRLIGADVSGYTTAPPPGLKGKYDYALLSPVPKAVFDAPTPPQIQALVAVIDHPPIEVELPDDGIRH